MSKGAATKATKEVATIEATKEAASDFAGAVGTSAFDFAPDDDEPAAAPSAFDFPADDVSDLDDVAPAVTPVRGSGKSSSERKRRVTFHLSADQQASQDAKEAERKAAPPPVTALSASLCKPASSASHPASVVAPPSHNDPRCSPLSLFLSARRCLSLPSLQPSPSATHRATRVQTPRDPTSDCSLPPCRLSCPSLAAGAKPPTL